MPFALPMIGTAHGETLNELPLKRQAKLWGRGSVRLILPAAVAGIASAMSHRTLAVEQASNKTSESVISGCLDPLLEWFQWLDRLVWRYLTSVSYLRPSHRFPSGRLLSSPSSSHQRLSWDCPSSQPLSTRTSLTPDSGLSRPCQLAMGTAKRGRRPELRVRTGCRRCRERRVKCPEQRPVCRSCELRGHVCSYELVLRWQDAEVLPNACGSRDKTSSGYTQHWMFLNASPRDFNNRQSLLSSPDSPDSDRTQSPEDLQPEPLPQQPLPHEPPQYVDNALTYWDIDNTTDFSSWLEQLDTNQCNSPWQSFQANFTIPPALSFLQMSPVESHLWEYFQKAISPSCVLNPKANPYQDVILRITAYGGRSSPVFHGVMSISAAQLYNLGDRSFLESSWTYRQQALQSLRLETAKYESEGQDVMRAGQIVAAILLMVFLEISHDCPDSWVLHANFGRSLIQSIEKHKILDPDIQSLFTFVKAYIVSHEVFAHTAWKPAERYEYNDVIDDLSGDDNIQTMTGCSTEFLQILSGVNVLAADVKRHAESASQSVEETRALDQRRLELERRLHGWNRDQQPNQTDKDIPESILIAETKRLAGLLYLYSRTSHLGPRDPCILRLTSRILDLISKVTFRTSAVLWPLFMVATLGVRPECDADRAAVLERIDSLQRTRQLGSVKKARKLIDNVWKLRDLKPSASNLGWDILELTACQDKLSLA